MSYTASLSVFLQRVNCNLLMAKEEGELVIECLKQQHSNAAFTQLYQTVKSFAAFVDVQENMPRTVGRQSYRSTVPSSSPEEYWRRSMYFPFLDHLIEEIQSRLLSPELEKYYSLQYLLPHNVSHLSNDQKVKESTQLIQQIYQVKIISHKKSIVGR